MTATLGFFVLIAVFVAWLFRSSASERDAGRLGWGSGHHTAASRQFDNPGGPTAAGTAGFDGGCSFGDGGGCG